MASAAEQSASSSSFSSKARYKTFLRNIPVEAEDSNFLFKLLLQFCITQHEETKMKLECNRFLV